MLWRSCDVSCGDSELFPSAENRPYITEFPNTSSSSSNERHRQYSKMRKLTIDISTSYSPRYDEFIQRMPDVRLCQTAAWTNMIHHIFGHKAFYVVATEGQVICGILPLTYVRSKLFGNRMISQAFSDYGGPCAENPDASHLMCEGAIRLATELRCDSLELRNIDPVPYPFNSRLDKVCMVAPLISDSDEFWKKNLKHKVRNRICKARKSHLVEIHGGSELLDDFYRIWTIRMHQLGTPCYPRKLFRYIMETFPDKTQVFLVRLNDLTLAGAFVSFFKGRIQIRWTASLIEYNSISPNSLLVWAIMEYYCEAGAKWSDFGRSTNGSSQYKFKKTWGAQPIQLHYQYWTPLGHKAFLVESHNPKYKKKIEMWKTLPLWATRLVGPYISRGLA